MQISSVGGGGSQTITTEDGWTSIIVENPAGHHEIIHRENDNRVTARICGFNEDTLFSVSCFGMSRRYKSLKGARKQAKKMILA